MHSIQLPVLYAIADTETLAKRGVSLRDFVAELLAAGVEMVQLRNKTGSPQEILQQAAEITALVAGTRCTPVMNDRADLACLAGWHAVHVGHRDTPPDAVRRILTGAARRPIVDSSFVGVSTHDDEQVRAADAGEADYVAVGPVFATGTKADAEPVIGLEGVRRARRLTRKPLVAIGGITLEEAAAARAAGADSVAVIGGFFRTGQRVSDVAARYLRALR